MATVTEPISDDRLAEIRDQAANAFTYDDYHRAMRAVPELLAEVERARGKSGRGPGVPAAMHLEAFGRDIADAFGECPYHVGSSATQKTGWRDVDVRLILDDDRFHALFPGFKNANHIDAWWALLCAALSELGRVRTGLPIDFQIQSMTEANEKYPGVRHPLFLIRAQDDHRPAMDGGDR